MPYLTREAACDLNCEAHEALGDPEKARFHYASFLRWWEEADPEKERARRGLERLTAEGRED